MLTTMMTDFASRMMAMVTTWMERHRTRNELSRLSAYELKDIGLTPGQARFEAAMPFWKP